LSFFCAAGTMQTMFDSIIGQDKVLSLLKHDITTGALSNSMLMHGPPSSGKLTTALEMVRVLNCSSNREETCNCSTCNRIRSLNFEGMIFLSRRDFSLQLQEYITSYHRDRTDALADRIRETIKLAVMPLQEFLIRDVFIEKDQARITSVQEKLWDIISGAELTPKLLDESIDHLASIQKLYRKKNIPINMVRAMLDWTYIHLPGIKRVAILDHVDYLEESSRNILLKRLEEPSQNLYFILIAENKTRILPTILSRCRSYYFRKPVPEDVNRILEQSWYEKGNYSSVYEFLTRSVDTSFDNMFPALINLLNLVFLPEHDMAELILFMKSLKDREYTTWMIKHLGYLMEKQILKLQSSGEGLPELKMLNTIQMYDLERMHARLLEQHSRIVNYGVNPQVAIEGIAYTMRSIVTSGKKIQFSSNLAGGST
jgi:DNA polymerase III delta prime subunit